MSENEQATGLVSMPTLQYNEEGWGPHEISEDFRVMPYQVHIAHRQWFQSTHFRTNGVQIKI